MDTKGKIDEIKQSLNTYIGRRVHVTAKKGNKIILARRGVLEHVYPNIFVVLLDKKSDNEGVRRVSFSFSDILTRAVEIVIFKEK